MSPSLVAAELMGTTLSYMSAHQVFPTSTPSAGEKCVTGHSTQQLQIPVQNLDHQSDLNVIKMNNTECSAHFLIFSEDTKGWSAFTVHFCLFVCLFELMIIPLVELLLTASVCLHVDFTFESERWAAFIRFV